MWDWARNVADKLPGFIDGQHRKRSYAGFQVRTAMLKPTAEDIDDSNATTTPFKRSSASRPHMTEKITSSLGAKATLRTPPDVEKSPRTTPGLWMTLSATARHARQLTQVQEGGDGWFCQRCPDYAQLASLSTLSRAPYSQRSGGGITTNRGGLLNVVRRSPCHHGRNRFTYGYSRWAAEIPTAWRGHNMRGNRDQDRGRKRGVPISRGIGTGLACHRQIRCSVGDLGGRC